MESNAQAQEYGSIVGDGSERLSTLEIESGGQFFAPARIRTTDGRTIAGQLFVDEERKVVFRETELRAT